MGSFDSFSDVHPSRPPPAPGGGHPFLVGDLLLGDFLLPLVFFRFQYPVLFAYVIAPETRLWAPTATGAAAPTATGAAAPTATGAAAPTSGT